MHGGWGDRQVSGNDEGKVGDGVEASDIIDAQVSGGTHGETTWDRYDGTEIGDGQVVG